VEQVKLEAFRREFESVGGVFYKVASVAMIPPVVARIAHEREARELVAWHSSALGADLTQALGARGLDVHEMPTAEPVGVAEREADRVEWLIGERVLHRAIEIRVRGRIVRRLREFLDPARAHGHRHADRESGRQRGHEKAAPRPDRPRR